MAEIRWTETAANWLKDIYDYIAQDSTSAAAKVVAGIYQKAQEFYENDPSKPTKPTRLGWIRSPYSAIQLVFRCLRNPFLINLRVFRRRFTNGATALAKTMPSRPKNRPQKARGKRQCPG